MPFDRANPVADGHRVIKVAIEKLVSTQDTSGAPSVAWTTYLAGVPAAMENLSGDERFADQQIEGIDRWQVLIPYVKGVNEKMRLNFKRDGTQYLLDITNVNNVNMQNRKMLLLCKSGVSRG